MATVRFSAGLRNVIISNARLMFRTQREKADESFNKNLANGVYDTLISEYKAHFDALPKEFIKTASEIDLHVQRPGPAVRIKLGTPKPFPLSDWTVPQVGRVVPHYSVPDVFLNADSPQWAAVRQEFEEWQNRREVVQNKEQEFVQMVSQVLDAHVTLAPALKVWPALWELLPEATKDKHKEVKERKSKKEEQLEGVDFSKLTAAVTVHKLKGQ